MQIPHEIILLIEDYCDITLQDLLYIRLVQPSARTRNICCRRYDLHIFTELSTGKFNIVCDNYLRTSLKWNTKEYYKKCSYCECTGPRIPTVVLDNRTLACSQCDCLRLFEKLNAEWNKPHNFRLDDNKKLLEKALNFKFVNKGIQKALRKNYKKAAAAYNEYTQRRNAILESQNDKYRYKEIIL